MFIILSRRKGQVGNRLWRQTEVADDNVQTQKDADALALARNSDPNDIFEYMVVEEK